jgi:large subunit ribosomal protein L30e
MDVNKEIRRVVDTGKVAFGFKSSEKNLLLGKAKALVLSTNATKPVREKVKAFSEMADIPLIEFNGTGLDLGKVCGKPFNVSVLTVLDEGKARLIAGIKK